MSPLYACIFLGLSLLAVYLLASVFLQRFVLFPRYITSPDERLAEQVPGLERLAIDTPEGKVELYFLPGDDVGAERPGPAVLFAHGNGELIEYWPEVLEPYRRLGMSVLLPEFRGYGRSSGSPSQYSITQDYIQSYDLLTRRPEVDAQRIIFHGRSVGGGAVCALARHRKPLVMILQSTFTSVTRMARRFLVPPMLVRDPFDNLAVVSVCDFPILIIHGRNDEIIPFWMGQRLQAAAPNAQLFAHDAGHNDPIETTLEYWERVRQFLQEEGLLEGAKE